MNTVRSIRTDFNEGDSYQKVIRFNYDGSLIVTGGCDGVLRAWKVHVRYIIMIRITEYNYILSIIVPQLNG